MLDSRRPLLLAGDVDAAELARLTAAGAPIVLSDSARRRLFVSPRTRGNRGPTLTATAPLDREAATFNPFPERGTDGQTVAVYSGLRQLNSPTAAGWSNFPQYRAYAALDGRLDTSWRADENVRPQRWYMELELARPRRVGAIEVVPQRDRRGRTESIFVSVNGGPERHVEPPGWAQPGRPRRRRGAQSCGCALTRWAATRTRAGPAASPSCACPASECASICAFRRRCRRAARGLDLSRSPIEILLAAHHGRLPLPRRCGRARPRGRSPARDARRRGRPRARVRRSSSAQLRAGRLGQHRSRRAGRRDRPAGRPVPGAGATVPPAGSRASRSGAHPRPSTATRARPGRAISKPGEPAWLEWTAASAAQGDRADDATRAGGLPLSHPRAPERSGS